MSGSVLDSCFDWVCDSSIYVSLESGIYRKEFFSIKIRIATEVWESHIEVDDGVIAFWNIVQEYVLIEANTLPYL